MHFCHSLWDVWFILWCPYASRTESGLRLHFIRLNEWMTLLMTMIFERFIRIFIVTTKNQEILGVCGSSKLMSKLDDIAREKDEQKGIVNMKPWSNKDQSSKIPLSTNPYQFHSNNIFKHAEAKQFKQDIFNMRKEGGQENLESRNLNSSSDSDHWWASPISCALVLSS